MCGVAGVHAIDGRTPSQPLLDHMVRLLEHRGPDEAATWVGPGIGLAHTRLSIIDVAGSHQPMHSVDGRWVLAFNGEIFNHAALRATLNYAFRTRGDTEVIVAGLALEGIGFVERLHGQFAFVAHDLATRTTHLVRDRLGVLPLYYRPLPGGHAFGSEIKAVLATGPRPEVDAAQLDDYLAARAVPAPRTLFTGVSKLPAGHRAWIGPDGELRTARYWEPPESDPPGTWGTRKAVDTVAEAVRAAVEAALVADVPVGAHLSGGVDSSLIVAHMQQLRGGEPVTTFSAGFGDPRNDDLPWAQRVSDLIGTDHHEVHLRESNFEDLLPLLTWYRDAPLSEPADIAVYALAREARQHVRVVLSGEGGDELFGGYPKHRYANIAERLAMIPHPVRSVLFGAVETRLGRRHARARIALRAMAAREEATRLQTWFAPFTETERRLLLGGTTPQRPTEQVDGTDALERMLRHDLAAWLPDNLLERGDRMSMAASLELRPPLLDHRLVELAFRLPSSVKVRGGTTKWVLKEAARRHLPAEVVDRPKVGFRVPLDAWFRGGLRDTAWDRLTGTDSWVGQTLDRRALRTLLERHQQGAANEESRLWTLLCLEVWHECFFQSSSAQSGAISSTASWTSQALPVGRESRTAERRAPSPPAGQPRSSATSRRPTAGVFFE